MCSLHTRGRRQLNDMNDMSQMTNVVMNTADMQMEADNDDDRQTEDLQNCNDEDTFH